MLPRSALLAGSLAAAFSALAIAQQTVFEVCAGSDIYISLSVKGEGGATSRDQSDLDTSFAAHFNKSRFLRGTIHRQLGGQVVSISSYKGRP